MRSVEYQNPWYYIPPFLDRGVPPRVSQTRRELTCLLSIWAVSSFLSRCRRSESSFPSALGMFAGDGRADIACVVPTRQLLSNVHHDRRQLVQTARREASQLMRPIREWAQKDF
jgi:hypothetical protein